MGKQKLIKQWVRLAKSKKGIEFEIIVRGIALLETN